MPSSMLLEYPCRFTVGKGSGMVVLIKKQLGISLVCKRDFFGKLSSVGRSAHVDRRRNRSTVFNLCHVAGRRMFSPPSRLFVLSQLPGIAAAEAADGR